MANVLPIEEKKRVLRTLRARFITVTALVLLLGATLAALALSPAILSVRLAQANLPSDETLSETARDDQAKHARAFALVGALGPIANSTSSPVGMFTAALAEKPASVHITSINYSRGRLILSGDGGTRQAMNAYKEALETSGSFTTVEVPVAALVGTQEGRFTITLTGAF